MKGFGVIHRFSEDIDIRIEPFDGLQGRYPSKSREAAAHRIEASVLLQAAEKVEIPGITAVGRDRTYDDETFRNAGLRLSYLNVTAAPDQSAGRGSHFCRFKRDRRVASR